MLESSKVPALTRAIDILNLIARIGPCSAATIIDELGIPKSTAYLLLGELRKQRFLSMDNQDNYCLWTKLVELAGHALSKMDLRELARPRLTQLMDQCGLLCHLGIIDGGNAYYILKIESPATISVRSHEGKACRCTAPVSVNACLPGSPSGFRSQLSASCSGRGQRQPPSPAPSCFAMNWGVFAPAAGASITAKIIPTFAAWRRRF